jgi:rubrerythrin
LVDYAEEIEKADNGILKYETDERLEECIHFLAAALRAERARVVELETEKRLASEWKCAICGRINPGTMPHCPCREET